jgi:hypothetical protein
MQEWAESVWIAISVIIAAAIVSVAVILSSMATNIINEVHEDRRASTLVQEYRKTHQWDGTDVHPQDIVSLVFETRGSPAVYVFKDTPTFPINPEVGKPTPTLAEIQLVSGMPGTSKWDKAKFLDGYLDFYSTEFSATAITGVLNKEKMYRSYVAHDDNGAIIFYWMYEK